MGKNSKKTRRQSTPEPHSSAAATTPTAAALPPRPTLPDVLAALGTPVAEAPFAGLHEGPTSRLYLHPETMHARRITTAELLLVGASTAAAPLQPPLSPAAAFPSALPQVPSPTPQPLVPLLYGFAISTSRAVQLPNQLLGSYAILAEAWPSLLVQRGAAALSGSLVDSLGRPSAGAALVLHRWSEGGHPTSTAGPEPATPHPPSTPANGGSHAAKPPTPPPTPPISSEDAAAADSKLASPSAAANATTDAAATLLPEVITLRLVGMLPRRGKPQAAEPQAAASQPSRSQNGAARGNGGALTAGGDRTEEDLAEAGSRQRRLLGLLAARQLSGRRLLPGNPVVLPALGSDCVFCVLDSRLPAGQARAVARHVTAQTPFRLLGRDEDDDRHAVTSRDSRDVVNPVAGPDNIIETANAAAAAAADAAAEAVGGGAEGPAARAAAQAARAGAAAIAAGSAGWAAVGGAEHLHAVLHELVTLPLQSPHLFAHYGVRPPRGVLLFGPPGTGKSTMARAAAAAARAALFVINGPDVVSEFLGDSEAGLRGIFAAARAAAPAVVFIDEIDAVAPSRGEPGGDDGSGAAASGPAGDMSSRVVATLLTEMDGAATDADRVVVLAATNRPDALDPALRRAGRLDRELEVGVPSPAARLGILRVKLAGLRHTLTEEQVAAMARVAHGFVGADIAALCSEAAMTALRRCVAADESGEMRMNGGAAPPLRVTAAEELPSEGGASMPPLLRVTAADFAAAETRVRPSAMREVALEVPNVSWDDVGGLDDVKQSLKEAVEWPQQNPEALARLGGKPPAGVLLYGQPGCSKTLLARAVAAEARLNFLAVKGPELFSKYVGESEKAVAALFARARQAAPAIVFFDEIDGLAAARSGAGGAPGVGDRVLSQLLGEMDGLQSRAGVVVIAATNRPDLVDPALLRPGRFDRLLHVPRPDAAGRAAVLAVLTRRTPLDPDVDLTAIAADAEGYTGADLAAVCREAALAALQEDIEAVAVADRHFSAALRAVVPSPPPPPALAAVYERYQRAGR